MSSLPSAHASQRFGRRQIEFFAVSGHVTGSAERARSSQRSIQDLDGANHTIRVSDRNTRLDEGDSIAVLRLQSGPDRRSRPVSAINYTADAWTELGRGASATLSRTGISRGGVWWFAILAFMLTALAIVWSDLRLFLVEVNSDWFGGAPDFQLLPWLNGLVPALSGFDLAGLIPGFSDMVGATGVLGAEQANAVAIGLVLTLLGLVAFAARTWRIIWVPVFILAALCAGLMLAPEQPDDVSLIALGVGALFFVIAGFFNRVRDAARLKSRIERLSEHLLRHPPVESVSVPVATPVEDAAPAEEAPLTEEAAPEAEALSDAPDGEPRDEIIDEADNTDPSPPESETRSDATVTASATAMAAVAAAVMSENDSSAEDDAPNDIDDLPSDAELAAAQNDPETENSATESVATETPTTDEAGTVEPPIATPSDAPTETAQDEPPRDRDMILPAPPPMATPEDNAADQETISAPAPVTDMHDSTNENLSDESAEPPAETLTATPSVGPETSISETIETEAAEIETANSEESSDAPDLSGDDPMMSDVVETDPVSESLEASTEVDNGSETAMAEADSTATPPEVTETTADSDTPNADETPRQ